MATIENTTPAEGIAQLRDMNRSQLMAQELVQQGSVHAVSFLLANGCTEALATSMLESLQYSAALIRTEIERRGTTPLFADDQVGGANA